MRYLAMLLLAGASSAVIAQPPSVAVGARVSIDSRGSHEITGMLMSQTADSMTVGLADGTFGVVAVTGINRLRVSEGLSHAQGAKKGAKLGALIGGLGWPAVFLGAYVFDDSPNKGTDGLAAWMGVAAVVGGLEGAVIGVIAGAAGGAEKWSTVYQANPRLTLRRTTNGATGIGISIPF